MGEKGVECVRFGALSHLFGAEWDEGCVAVVVLKGGFCCVVSLF